VENLKRNKAQRKENPFYSNRLQSEVVRQANPSRQMVVREHRYLMGRQEAWELMLVRALFSPSYTFIPPSIVFDDAPNMAILANLNMYPTGDTNSFGSTPTGVVVNFDSFSANTSLPIMKMLRFNYNQTSGVAHGTLSVPGGATFWAWADPYDARQPIKYSMGPSASSLAPGQVYGPWTCGVGQLGSAGPWMPNYASEHGGFHWEVSPLNQSTNWTQGTYPTTQIPINGSYYELYPPVPVTRFDATITESASNLYFVQNSVLRVEVADPTMFVGIGMVTRNVGRCFNRVLNRIEDPSTGVYGNCDNYTSCGAAEAVWSSDKWQPCRFSATLSGEDSIPVPNPDTGSIVGTGDFYGSVYAWGNLNRMLEEGYPVIQVQTSSNGTGASVDFSFTLEAKVAYTPLWQGNNNCGSTLLTAPYSIPPWFSCARSHGYLTGKTGGKMKSYTSGGASPWVPGPSARAQQAFLIHPGNTQATAAVQHAIAQAKQPSKAMDEVHNLVKEAAEGGGLAGFAKGVWNVVKRISRGAAEAVESSGPIITEVAEEAPALLAIA